MADSVIVTVDRHFVSIFSPLAGPRGTWHTLRPAATSETVSALDQRRKSQTWPRRISSVSSDCPRNTSQPSSTIRGPVEASDAKYASICFVTDISTRTALVMLWAALNYLKNWRKKNVHQIQDVCPHKRACSSKLSNSSWTVIDMLWRAPGMRWTVVGHMLR